MKISPLDLLAIRTLAATSVFVVTSIVCIQLVARNNPISEGLTLFSGGFFALILAVLGVDGWQSMKTAAQKRDTEWKPSQQVVDQIQLSRKMGGVGGTEPMVQPFVPPATAGSTDPAVVAGLEAIAARQRESTIPVEEMEGY